MKEYNGIEGWEHANQMLAAWFWGVQVTAKIAKAAGERYEKHEKAKEEV